MTREMVLEVVNELNDALRSADHTDWLVRSRIADALEARAKELQGNRKTALPMASELQSWADRIRGGTYSGGAPDDRPTVGTMDERHGLAKRPGST